jgi:hypothetical protein
MMEQNHTEQKGFKLIECFNKQCYHHICNYIHADDPEDLEIQKCFYNNLFKKYENNIINILAEWDIEYVPREIIKTIKLPIHKLVLNTINKKRIDSGLEPIKLVSIPTSVSSKRWSVPSSYTEKSCSHSASSCATGMRPDPSVMSNPDNQELVQAIKERRPVSEAIEQRVTQADGWDSDGTVLTTHGKVYKSPTLPINTKKETPSSSSKDHMPVEQNNPVDKQLYWVDENDDAWYYDYQEDCWYKDGSWCQEESWSEHNWCKEEWKSNSGESWYYDWESETWQIYKHSEDLPSQQEQQLLVEDDVETKTEEEISTPKQDVLFAGVSTPYYDDEDLEPPTPGTTLEINRQMQRQIKMAVATLKNKKNKKAIAMLLQIQESLNKIAEWAQNTNNEIIKMLNEDTDDDDDDDEDD